MIWGGGRGGGGLFDAKSQRQNAQDVRAGGKEHRVTHTHTHIHRRFAFSRFCLRGRKKTPLFSWAPEKEGKKKERRKQNSETRHGKLRFPRVCLSVCLSVGGFF